MKVDFAFPTELKRFEEIERIRFADEDGAITLLERHLDYVTALAVCVVELVPEEGKSTFLGVDGGILVKKGGEVRVSSFRGIEGESVESLWRRMEESFRKKEENAKKVRSILTKLEVDMAKRLFEEGEI
jgi:F-type H+-transporting ATPase subunit epsilon